MKSSIHGGLLIVLKNNVCGIVIKKNSDKKNRLYAIFFHNVVKKFSITFSKKFQNVEKVIIALTWRMIASSKIAKILF